MDNLRCPRCGNTLSPGQNLCRNCGFSTDCDEIYPPGTILRGRYEIQQSVHSGSMSCVYLCKDKSLFERSCVIKQVRERIQSEEHRKKLEEEALRMAKLSHPGIAMIFDHFVEQDHYFLVVEYIHGKTLSEFSRERELTEEQVVIWGISICDVLIYIHGQGIIHRDISPDNIMLTEEGSIKFIDFGTLRELRKITTGGTAGMGKYGYTAPEQWQGKPGPQSDIFALGATMYELLTGFLPLSKSYLDGKGPQKEDFSPKFPPIRSISPNVSLQLEMVLRKALELDIDKRYVSTAEMKETLVNIKREATARQSELSFSSVPNHDNGKESSKPGISNKHITASEKNNRKSRSKTGKPRRRVISEVSESTIRRKTISDTFQHPITLLSLAVCIVSIGYLLLLSPMFGGSIGAIVIVAISAITALISYFLSYPNQYLKNTRELIELMETERAEAEYEELTELQEILKSGFASIASIEGTRALQELVSEYEQLQPALGQQRAEDPLMMSLIPALAGETYRRGLRVLSDALDLMNVIHTPGKERLEAKITELEREIETLKNNRTQEERLKLRQEILASFKERLGILNKLQLSADHLLFQAQRCEASLHNARIEIATIRTGSTKSSVDSVVELLQERIRQVKEVQDELTRMGY